MQPFATCYFCTIKNGIVVRSIITGKIKVREQDINLPIQLPLNENETKIKADDYNLYGQIDTSERDKMISIIGFLNCFEKQLKK